MRARTRGAALLVAGACTIVRPAAAQAPATPPPAPEIWVLGLEAESGWESNVRFQRAGDPGDQVNRLNATGLRSWQGPRGHLSFTGRGSATAYREVRDLNRFTYDLLADGSRRLTERMTVTGGAVYDTRLSSEINASGPGLPILPLTQSHSVGGSLGAAYRLTPLTSVTTRAEYTRVTFDAPELIPGDAFNARATLGHHYTRGSSLALVAEAQQGSTQGRPLATQTAAAEWDASRGDLESRLQAGVTRSSAGATPHYGPSGAAELRARIRAGVAFVRASRLVSQAFGLGTLLTTDQVAIGYDRASIFGTVLHVGASRAWSSNTAVDAGRLATSDATADLLRVFRSGVTIGGGAFVRRRVDVQRVTGTGVHIAIGYRVGASR